MPRRLLTLLFLLLASVSEVEASFARGAFSPKATQSGLIPDGINTLLHLTEGNDDEAEMSALAMIPIFGDGAKAAKMAAKHGDEALAALKKADDVPAAKTANTNPYKGPVTQDVIAVDPKGNAIPVKSGQQLTGSPDGRFVQVRDAQGNPTGLRIDGGHPVSHPDPRAQVPHAHIPGITNPDGTPWLPINQ